MDWTTDTTSAKSPAVEHDFSTEPLYSWDYDQRLKWCFTHHDWEEVDG